MLSPQGRSGGPPGRRRAGAAAAGSAVHHREVRVREDVRPAGAALRPGGPDVPGAAAVHQLQRRGRHGAGR